MGITIHYSGHARDGEAVKRVVERAAAFAAERGWNLQRLDDIEIERVRITGEAPDAHEFYPVRVSGVILTPHPDNECVMLLFDAEHFTQWSTKTQYMPLQTHVQIVRLLRELEPLFADLEVMDEGGYWETGDTQVLVGKMAFLRRAIDGLARELGAEGP